MTIIGRRETKYWLILESVKNCCLLIFKQSKAFAYFIAEAVSVTVVCTPPTWWWSTYHLLLYLLAECGWICSLWMTAAKEHPGLVTLSRSLKICFRKLMLLCVRYRVILPFNLFRMRLFSFMCSCHVLLSLDRKNPKVVHIFSKKKINVKNFFIDLLWES